MNNTPANSDQQLCSITSYSAAGKLHTFFYSEFPHFPYLHSDTLVYYYVIVVSYAKKN